MLKELLSSSVHARRLRQVRKRQVSLEQLDDRAIKNRCRGLQFAARSTNRPQSLLLDAFALISEATRRVHSMVPYDVQMLGGMQLCSPRIVEMATGEGKTLTALLPLFFRALPGKGMLLATSNDYLAQRDAEFAAPVFEFLGMTVGAISEDSEDQQRRDAYQCDVTYGTAVQFGFDFLRDRAKRRFNQVHSPIKPEAPVGRGELHAILLDEADSLLVDEAATPLLIAGKPPAMTEERKENFLWASKLAPECREGEHFHISKSNRQPELTNAGRKWLHQRLPEGNDRTLSLLDYYEYLERAINVHHEILCDRNYIIQNDEVQLVDEGTGRIGKGRQWSDGVQQAVQAKEGLPLTMPAGHLAKVTIQSFFLSFDHVSGMTGTGMQAAREFRRTYKLGISVIPTRLPNARHGWQDLAMPDYDSWLDGIREECVNIVQQGRSVIIGARNVAHSEMISKYLFKHDVNHQLLNARLDAEEAEIISGAGQPGRVTVATNMAGRGTDIKLDDQVREAGGLHVILAGIHPSKRIDRQLIGRAGRQGDPGSYRRILCLHDDLLEEAFDTKTCDRSRESLTRAFSVNRCVRLFERAQMKITQRNRFARRTLFDSEKKQLRYLYQAGLDPLLDIPG